MNKRAFIRNTFFAAVALSVPGCLKKQAASNAYGVDYYTCTMHPSVHSAEPGKCPICSMDLVPVMKGGAAAPGEASGSNEFTVPVERQQQIGVTYAVAQRRPLRRTLRAAGIIQPDASKMWRFVARTEGYVENLLVAAPGAAVEKETPLMSIYSPDLLTAEREFLQLSKSGGQPAEAARKRLRQWNVADSQIDALLKSGVPTENLTLLSPFRGMVQAVAAQQGANVKQGDTLMEIADYSGVWVWAEFYESELSMLKQGQKVRVTSRAWPGEKFEAEVTQINPALDEATRSVKVRIDIRNEGLKLRPGMYASVELEADLGEAMAIPVSAVMPTGKRNIAFVDKGEGKLQPRLLQLGRECDDYYEVLSGVESGERVVASANFLIDAESQVTGALKNFGNIADGANASTDGANANAEGGQ